MTRVLFVDDDQKILRVIARYLGEDFDITTVSNPLDALKLLGAGEGFAIVVSDLRMPEMDGIEFLSRVKGISPSTVRLMLTGNANLEQAVEAVNRDEVFRLLLKPCDPDVLAEALRAGLRQYELERAERELLHKTVTGSLALLSELLSSANRLAYGRSSRVRPMAVKLARELKGENLWNVDIAAMLCQIGCSAVSNAILAKVYEGKDLSDEEVEEYNTYPALGHSFLRHLPRMERVARIILYQEKHFDGQGIPFDDVCGKDIPLGSRILKVLLDYDVLEQGEASPLEAVGILRTRSGWYDGEVLEAFARELERGEAAVRSVEVEVENFPVGGRLGEDLRTRFEAVLMPKGAEITESNKRGLLELSRNGILEKCVYWVIPRD